MLSCCKPGACAHVICAGLVLACASDSLSCVLPQETGLTHMRISDGVGSRLQLSGLLARMCKLSAQIRRK